MMEDYERIAQLINNNFRVTYLIKLGLDKFLATLPRI